MPEKEVQKEKKKQVVGVIVVLLIAVIVIAVSIFSNSDKGVYPNIVSPRPVFGNPNASVTVIEFSDLQCPACRAAEPIVERIMIEYKDRIRFEFKHFPLKMIHPNAMKAAEASECANDQGRFWDYLASAYASPSLDRTSLKRIAKNLNLNTTSFNLCLNSGAKADIVNTDLAEAVARNLPGTPMIFVNDRLIEDWSYETFKAEIEKALASSK